MMHDMSVLIDEFVPFSEANPIERQQAILALQEHVGSLEQTDCPVKHHFAPGNYAREIFIPARTLVVGKIHKHSHVNVISKGRVSVATKSGIVELEAPCTFVSEPGTKRAVLAITDVVWTTIHPTQETDLEKIEDEVIAKSYKELELFNRKQIEGVLP